MTQRIIKFRAWDGERMDYDPLVGCAGSEDYNVNEAFTDKANTDKRIWTQFTGLLDKNGKEIFEGDIVKKGNTNLFLVKAKQLSKWFSSIVLQL